MALSPVRQGLQSRADGFDMFLKIDLKTQVLVEVPRQLPQGVGFMRLDRETNDFQGSATATM
ncbi:hypothetical protein DS843_22880 [Roseomonas genomospecies 6]|uniref:Uncharacterized protein n=1 Tax=Roseomonas genomospecies 6 TaxID=214106 RepID=A0A9W7KQI9_9PROT|nr:hypothetical protein DS843_22880 [Roseomonas genomospecies 6]